MKVKLKLDDSGGYPQASGPVDCLSRRRHTVHPRPAEASTSTVRLRQPQDTGPVGPTAGVAASNFFFGSVSANRALPTDAHVRGGRWVYSRARRLCGDPPRQPESGVGRPELRGSLVGDADTATVVVDVENRGPTGEIRVIAEVVNHDDIVLDSYERTAEIEGGETHTFEVGITPREDAATVTVQATSG